MRLIQVDNKKLFYLEIRSIKFWFSYETIIGITNGNSAIIAINEWSNTTAKHLNYIKKNYNVALQIPHKELLDYIDVLI